MRSLLIIFSVLVELFLFNNFAFAAPLDVDPNQQKAPSNSQGWTPIGFRFPDEELNPKKLDTNGIKPENFCLVDNQIVDGKQTQLINVDTLNQMSSGRIIHSYLENIGVAKGQGAYRLENIWGEQIYHFVTKETLENTGSDTIQGKQIQDPALFVGKPLYDEFLAKTWIFNPPPSGNRIKPTLLLFNYPNNWVGGYNTDDVGANGFGYDAIQTGVPEGQQPKPGANYKGKVQITYNYLKNIPAQVKVRIYHYSKGQLTVVKEAPLTVLTSYPAFMDFDWTASDDSDEQLVVAVNGTAQVNEQGVAVFNPSSPDVKEFALYIPDPDRRWKDGNPNNETLSNVNVIATLVPKSELDNQNLPGIYGGDNRGYRDNLFSKKTHIGNLTAQSVILQDVPAKGPIAGQSYGAYLTFKNSVDTAYRGVGVRAYVNGSPVTLYSAKDPVTKVDFAPGETKTYWFTIPFPEGGTAVSFGGDINLSGARQPEKTYDDNRISDSAMAPISLTGSGSQLILEAYNQDWSQKRDPYTAKWGDVVKATLKPIAVERYSGNARPDPRTYITPPSPPPTLSSDGPITTVMDDWQIVNPDLVFPLANPEYSFGHPLEPETTTQAKMQTKGYTAEGYISEDWSHAGQAVYDIIDNVQKDEEPRSYPIKAKFKVRIEYHYIIQVRDTNGQLVPRDVPQDPITLDFERNAQLLVNGTGAVPIAQ